MDNIKCAICLEEIKEENVNLKCNHKYCINCFVLHSRVSHMCPLCRRVYSEPINIPRFSSSINITDEQVSEIHMSLLTHFVLYNIFGEILSKIESLNKMEDKQDYMNFAVSDIIKYSIDFIKNMV